MPEPVEVVKDAKPAIPPVGGNGKQEQFAADAKLIAEAKLAVEAAEAKAAADAKLAAEAKAQADAKAAELERRAADAAAARSTMSKAADDANKTAEDLRRLVDVAQTLTDTAEPTDAKLLLDELEAMQRTNPAILKDKRAAAILAHLVALAEALSRARQPESVYRQARLAVRAAAAGHLDLAEAIVKALRLEVSSNAPAYLVLKGAVVSFLTVVALGIITFALYFWIFSTTTAEPLPLEVSASVAWGALSTNIVVVSATFGLLGSLVSVLLRLSDFDGSRRSRQFLIFTGGVLPIVGAIFATVVCAIFASEIVGTSLVPQPAEGTPTSIYFYMVVGFVAGFSERFARNLVGYFETKATPGPEETKAKPKPT